MRLELSQAAQADLDRIEDYSVREFGVERAIAYIDGVEQAFRRILNYPAIGGVQDDLRPSIRSLACQRHRIFYAVETDAVLIVRVLHAAQDAKRHL